VKVFSGTPWHLPREVVWVHFAVVLISHHSQPMVRRHQNSEIFCRPGGPIDENFLPSFARMGPHSQVVILAPTRSDFLRLYEPRGSRVRDEFDRSQSTVPQSARRAHMASSHKQQRRVKIAKPSKPKGAIRRFSQNRIGLSDSMQLAAVVEDTAMPTKVTGTRDRMLTVASSNE